MARFREVSIIPELSIVMECPPKPYERFKELLPSLTEHTKSIGGQLYEIRPTTVHEEYHSILGEHSSIGDVLDERGKKKHIANFPCSATLYEFCKGSVGKRPKIVTDAYSVERSEILFAAFSELEVRLRKRIVKDENLNRMIDDLNLEGIRLKDGNHKVSNMTLFEIITLVLMSPCSENYYLERVEESDRSNEALATLRGLRVLDEVYFPLNFEELDRLRNIRNACMHFKIITHDDFLFCKIGRAHV